MMNKLINLVLIMLFSIVSYKIGYDTCVRGWMERDQYTKLIQRWLDTRLQDLIQANYISNQATSRAQDQTELYNRQSNLFLSKAHLIKIIQSISFTYSYQKHPIILSCKTRLLQPYQERSIKYYSIHIIDNCRGKFLGAFIYTQIVDQENKSIANTRELREKPKRGKTMVQEREFTKQERLQ